MQAIHHKFRRKLMRMRVRQERKKLNSARQRIFSELQAYKTTKGELPSETVPIWTELSKIQERFIELNWQMAGRTLNLSKSVVPGIYTLTEKLEWLN